jgi:electron transport complex protein RnfB
MTAFFLAKIDEAECIGCTKCISACPYDAIIGAPQQLHVVLDTECTGCKLCITPCPVDCISLVSIEKPLFDRTKIKKRKQAKKIRETQDHFAKPLLNAEDAKHYLEAILKK